MASEGEECERPERLGIIWFSLRDEGGEDGRDGYGAAREARQRARKPTQQKQRRNRRQDNNDVVSHSRDQNSCRGFCF